MNLNILLQKIKGVILPFFHFLVSKNLSWSRGPLHIVTFSAKNMVSRKKHLTPMLMLKMMIPSKTLKLCRPSCKFIDTCHMCSWWGRFKASLLQWTSQFWAWNMATHSLGSHFAKFGKFVVLSWPFLITFFVGPFWFLMQKGWHFHSIEIVDFLSVSLTLWRVCRL